MRSKRTRLDRYISQTLGVNRGDVRAMLAQGRLHLDGVPATDIHQPVDEFTRVVMDGKTLQDKKPIYLMLHKPSGVVSATKDDKHTTVIDLLDHPQKHELHIVGRLDFNTSGLMLLTNDGRWSRQLTQPESKVIKRYRVILEHPLTQDYIAAFAEGMYFAFEDITTRPAQLIILGEYEAEVALVEGRYHQIKRMFGRFQNPVVGLHRIAIGNLQLGNDVAVGQSRMLTTDELNGL